MLATNSLGFLWRSTNEEATLTVLLPNRFICQLFNTIFWITFGLSAQLVFSECLCMVCPIPHLSECNCLKFLLTIRYNLLKIDPPPVPRNSFYGNCLVVEKC